MIGGGLLGMPLLLTIGVTSLFVALMGLFALMTVSLVGRVIRGPGADIFDPVVADRASASTPPTEH